MVKLLPGKSIRLVIPLLLGLAALPLSSCGLLVMVRSPHQVPFNEAEFAGYGGPGSGTVTGQLTAYYDGEAHRGDGTPITLMPVTPYTREIVDRELGDGVYLSRPDARFKKYIRVTTSDHQGGFVFTRVPPGEYFVLGEASWNARGNSDLLEFQWACERITVRNGQTTSVLVSHNPQHGNSPVQGLFTVD